MTRVDIYTDGACSSNPGPGGWAAILLYGENAREISGFEASTTNNRMELRAVIEGLSLLKRPCEVTVYSDSAYVVDAFAKRWIHNWQRNGWQTSTKDPVKNQDLWQHLLELSQIHTIHWRKVKGHADNQLNNRCDALARGEIQSRSQ